MRLRPKRKQRLRHRPKSRQNTEASDKGASLFAHNSVGEASERKTMSEAKRLTVKQLAEENGFESVEEMLTDAEFNGENGTCVALCEDGCVVEPDGRCPHGHPSLLIAMGLI